MLVRLYLRTLAVLAVFAAAGACSAHPPYGRVHATVHRMETGIGQCTATAVGRNLLLSAEHCGVTSPGRVILDGIPADVEEVVADGRDHVLFRVTLQFKDWAQVAKDAPQQGDAVFVWGNPEALSDVLRVGTYAGQTAYALLPGITSPTRLYDIEGGHGDSGAAIFDARGRIVDVLSGGYTPTEDFRLIGAMPMAFTPAQWAEVAS